MRKHKKRKTRPVLDRIMEEVVKDPISGCWNFCGGLNENGYGRINISRRHKKHMCLVHREIYKIYVGDIPEGMFVCHKCDNPPCCNPNHLFLGTPLDNMRDMWNKGRKVIPSGEKAYYHKFTDKQVAEIRKDQRSLRAIAKDYGVAWSHIGMIKNFQTRVNG